MVKRRKKLRTRLTAVLLTFGMVASSVATNLPGRVFGVPDEAREVYAETNTWTDEEHGVVFEYEDLAEGGVVINGIKPSDTTVEDGTLDIVIPDTIDGKAVKDTKLGITSSHQNKYKSLTINSTSLKTLSYPFARSCEYLQSVAFAEDCQIETIADEAFKGCISLTTITLPNTVETIGRETFSGCNSLTTVNLGSSVKTIGESAFQGTKLASISFPASLTEIGKSAFYNLDSLTEITFPADSELTTIGETAFYHCDMTELNLPNSLEEIGEDAFKYCAQIKTITWPQNNPKFTTIRGFYGSSGLENSVLRNIPSSVTTIADNAFYQTHFSEIYISPFISTIGKNAFANDEGFLRGDIIIADSSVELTIEEKAFYQVFDNTVGQYTADNPKEIVLPKRVVEIQDGSFDLKYKNNHKFTIKNDSIRIVGDPWTNLGYTYFSYPNTLTEEKSPSFTAYKNSCEAGEKHSANNENLYMFSLFDPIVKHTITGTVPIGATVKAKINNGENTDIALDESNSFSFDTVEKSNIVITISKEGYKDYTLEMTSDMFATNWTIGEITIDQMVALSTVGNLDVTLAGEASGGVNISVFDENGDLYVSDSTGADAYALTGLPEGTYTVIAFANNGYISGISSLAGLNELGIAESNYAKASVTIEKEKTTTCSLTVPKMPTSVYLDVVDTMGSFVAVDRSTVTTNTGAYGKIFYQMKDGHKADSVKIFVPDGFNVTSVTTSTNSYPVESVYNADTGIITISGLAGDAKDSGTIYVGLVGESAGTYCISASVTSSSVTVPVGSYDFEVVDIDLVVKEDVLSTGNASITVYAQPMTEIMLSISGTEAQSIGTTNMLGYLITTVELTDEYIWGALCTLKAKAVINGHDCEDYETVRVVKKDVEIKDFFFIHANHKYYIVKDGVDKSNDYYTYVANGTEEAKYWTFGAVLRKSSSLDGDVMINIQMLDGSCRQEALSLISSKKIDSKTYETEYSASIYIDTAGNHVFDDSLVPEGFDLYYNSNVTTMKEIITGEKEVSSDDGQRDAARENSTDKTDKEKLLAAIDANAEAIYVKRKKAYEEAWTSLTNKYTVLPSEGDGHITAQEWLDNEIYEQFFDYNSFLFPSKIKGLDTLTEDEQTMINSLTAEELSEFEALDATMKEIMDALMYIMGSSKPLYEYKDLNEYLADNYETQESLYSMTKADALSKGYVIMKDSAEEGTVLYNFSDNSMLVYEYDGSSPKTSDGVLAATEGSRGSSDGKPKAAMKPKKNKHNMDKVNEYASTAENLSGYADVLVGSVDTIAEKYEYWNKPGVKQTLDVSGKITGSLNTVLGFNKWALQSTEYNLGLQETMKYEDKIRVFNRKYTLDDLTKKFQAGKISYDCYINRMDERRYLNILADTSRLRDEWVSDCVTLTATAAITGAVLLGAEFIVPAAAGGAATGGAAAAGAAAETAVGATGATAAQYISAASLGTGVGSVVLDEYVSAVTADWNSKISKCQEEYIKAHLKAEYGCADEKTKAKFQKRILYDPSGFVYEAVESNKVEGATATVIFADSGDAWDASAHEQVNPQITDIYGSFAWDVPDGTYKVKVEKDGYETAYTDALEVPPPRMDVRIPLVTKKAPEVESLNAYTDYIEIIFTQYMKIDDKSEIVATVNGKSVAASSFEWQDAEESPSGEKYAKVVRIPVPAGTKVGDTLDVQISKAKNYADIPMNPAYSEKAKVTHRPTEIILNYETVLTMQAGNDKNITVRIKDENGDYMEGVSISALIENEYLAELADATLVTDEEGKAVFKASALLPGLTNTTFKVDGTTLKKNIKVRIETEAVRPKRPTASIAGVDFSEGAPKENYLTVAAGSVLKLECATEGATIYYTLDDTCPCQNSSSRHEYTGPITITENCRIRIAAYKDGLEYSERINLNITVREPEEFEISYDLNGGTLNGKTGIIVEKHLEGEEITIPDAPTRDGYKFDYWQGSKLYPGDKYVITEDHTFKAVWIALDEDEQDDEEVEEVEDKDSPSGDKSSDDEASNDSNGSGAKDATIDVPDNSKSAENDVAAKTGDPFDPVLWTVIMLTAFAGWLAVIMLKKKRK